MNDCKIMCDYNLNDKKYTQKWLVKNHPDKGGIIPPDEFNKILECYKNDNFCEKGSLKNRLNYEEYKKYLEEIKNYYRLKNKYLLQKKILKDKIIVSSESLDVKKKLYAKQKILCVNCLKEGGTIFSETNKMLKATCGNVSNPCDLNIEIVKMNSFFVDDYLKSLNSKIDDLKNKIIHTKLDYFFKYIDEDKVVEVFEESKDLLNITQEKYNEYFSYYNSIINNNRRTNLLNDKLNEFYNYINEYKELIKLYKQTNNSVYFKEAIDLYINNIKILDNSIRYLKYKHIYINYEQDTHNEDKFFLIQKKYNIADLEIINFTE